MPYTMFHDLFPELAERETRSIILSEPTGGVPAGSYGLLELYCDEPDCDCRRVMLAVAASRSETIEAYIAYGWESPAFYSQWISDADPLMIRELKGPVLNSLSPQSAYAPAILNMVEQLVLRDPQYIERLKRHYRMFRDAIDQKRSSRKKRRKRRR